MTKIFFSTLRKSLSFLSKRPYYLFFGVLFTSGVWLPIRVQFSNSEKDITLFKSSFEQNFSSYSELYLVFILSLILIPWFLKLLTLSFVYLNIFSTRTKERNLSILQNLQVAFVSLPSLVSLRLLILLLILFLFLFLNIPISILIKMNSLYGSLFLGIIASILFSFYSFVLFSVFLFSQFFILFGKLSLREALKAGSHLYEKKKRESLFFVFSFFIFFLFVQIIIYFLPGFYFSEETFSILPLYPKFPPYFNILGFVVSYLLLSFYFTFFAITSTFFFLRIAKKPKEKELLVQETSVLSSPLLKKESETFPE